MFGSQAGDNLLGLEPSLAERHRGFRPEHQLSVSRSKSGDFELENDVGCQ